MTAREPHRVVWHIEPEEVRGTFVCDGDREAECHAYPDCTCGVSPCDHPRVPHAMCAWIPWLSEDSLQTYYDGARQPLRDDAVVVAWSNDFEGPAWHYADEVSES